MTSTELSALRSFYAGRRVLVTGHTGFKGSWLTMWLARLGADVHACALPPDQGPDNLFDRAEVARSVRSRFSDIRDPSAVQDVVADVQPELVFHLAARALVQHGYDDPIGTFAANVMGTTNVLEAARQCRTVAALVCVTTDKVYRNHEWAWPYRESDEIGGLDAYSASKAGAELVVRAYMHALKPKDRPFAIATARGGNVVGGGDWSPHRLVPDIVRAIRSNAPVTLRFPRATRPWQHVLDLCHAYLLLGCRLTLQGAGGPWNFGPTPEAEIAVADLVSAFVSAWGEPSYPVEHGASTNYEAMSLRLDSSRANLLLGWRPGLTAQETIAWSAEWYRAYVADSSSAAALVLNQIERYEAILDNRVAA